MRYVLAGLLAPVAALAAYQMGTGLLGLGNGLEAQLFGTVAGVMVAATYERVAAISAARAAVALEIERRRRRR